MAELASWDDVAAATGIPIRDLYRMRKLAGSPSARDPGAWRAFASSLGGGKQSTPRAKTESETAREEADLRFAQARARREERNDALESGRVVTKETAEGAATAVRDAFIAEGESLPTAVAALLPKFSRGDRLIVEDAVRAAWAEACNRIATGTARG